jgi:ATP-dependent RNA helicase DDX56/DBP9
MGRAILPFKFDMQPVERFRYRCQDALRSVTDTAVREARIKEIKHEILNSEKLKVCINNKGPFRRQSRGFESTKT